MRRRKVLGRQIVMALIMALVGMVVKKQNSEYAEYAWILVALGFSLVMALYGVRFWKKKSKILTDYTRLSFVIVASAVGLVLSFRLIRRISWEHPFVIIALAVTGIWMITEMLPTNKKRLA